MAKTTPARTRLGKCFAPAVRGDRRRRVRRNETSPVVPAGAKRRAGTSAQAQERPRGISGGRWRRGSGFRCAAPERRDVCNGLAIPWSVVLMRRSGRSEAESRNLGAGARETSRHIGRAVGGEVPGSAARPRNDGTFVTASPFPRSAPSCVVPAAAQRRAGTSTPRAASGRRRRRPRQAGGDAAGGPRGSGFRCAAPERREVCNGLAIPAASTLMRRSGRSAAESRNLGVGARGKSRSISGGRSVARFRVPLRGPGTTGGL